MQVFRVSGWNCGRQREHDKTFAPMTVFATGRLANKACAHWVLGFEGQSGQSAHNCLKLIVVWRVVHSERNERFERGKAGCEMADAGATLGWQRWQAQGTPCCMGVAFDEYAFG